DRPRGAVAAHRDRNTGSPAFRCRAAESHPGLRPTARLGCHLTVTPVCHRPGPGVPGLAAGMARYARNVADLGHSGIMTLSGAVCRGRRADAQLMAAAI